MADIPGSEALREQIKDIFGIGDSDFEITSEQDSNYNCISWAVEEKHRKWDPTGFYWPEGVDRNRSLNAHVDALRTQGFEVCKKRPKYDPSYEVVAFYQVKGYTDVEHISRQLNAEWWTSKLGNEEDIRHRHKVLEGGLYGDVTIYMRRKLQQ